MTTPPELTGTRVDGYVVGEMIGQGGMGSIYRGIQERFGREVAIKFLLKMPTSTEMLAGRFRKETKIHMRLSHPNLVKMLDAGVHLGFPYIVMELIEGESLHSMAERGPIHPTRRLLEICAAIARGLDYLGEQGVQHRDIKPANVIVGRDGIIKICDFGLAHMDGRTPLTTPGALLGSLPYMAPEFIRGEAHDLSSDAYSFGVLVYRLATGQLPYRGAGVPEWVQLITEAIPAPVSDHRPDAPEALVDLVDRLLAKTPGDRATVAEASQVLDRLIDTNRISAGNRRRGRSRAVKRAGLSRKDLALALLLSVLLACLGVLVVLAMR